MARWKRKTLLLKKELTYGTDPTPTGAANAILGSDFEITPLEDDRLERNLLKIERGTDAELVANTRVSVKFGVEMAGSGTKDIAPAYRDALLACALAETVNATVDVEYDPISAADDSCAIYFNMDGTQHKVLGARGSVALDLAKNALPHWSFEFTGLYVAPAAGALPAADFSAFTAPLAANTANTATFALHGFAGVLAELKIDLANDVRLRKFIGAETVEIIDRAPTGQVTIEAPALATKDFFAIAAAGTEGALQVVHGTLAGNIVQIDAPKVQIANPRYVDLEGVTGLQMDLKLNRNAGDDELKITTK